jgi:hypothetical protein
MDTKVANVQEQAQGLDPSEAGADRDYRASEQFRAECEARYVLSKPLAERREYLRGVEEHRGIAGRKYLERVILSEWQKKAPAKGGLSLSSSDKLSRREATTALVYPQDKKRAISASLRLTSPGNTLPPPIVH